MSDESPKFNSVPAEKARFLTQEEIQEAKDNLETPSPDQSLDTDPQQDDAGQQKEVEKQKTLVRDILKRLYHSRAESIEPKVQMVDPRTLDYKEHSEQASDWQSAIVEQGAITLNPEMIGRDLESLEVFVDLPQFSPETAIFDVMQHIVDTYGKTHLIPGLEYWEWLLENPDKVPEKLKIEDRRYWYYFPGSLYANSSKKWEVPAYHKGRSESISSRGVGGRWSSSSRVVLLANPEICANSVKTALADLDAKFGAEEVSRVLYENFNGGIKDNAQPLVQEYWKVMKELQGKLGWTTVVNARKAECEARLGIES